MTPAATIQAAIDKLTAIRAENDYQIVNGWLVEDTGSGSEHIGGMRVDDGRQPVTNDPMVVTLYATIDAQLELLKIALDYGDLQVGRGSRFVHAAQHLARAILDKETP